MRQTTDPDEISGAIIKCAIEIHRALGPGLPETVYSRVLSQFLDREGFWVQAFSFVAFRLRHSRALRVKALT